MGCADRSHAVTLSLPYSSGLDPGRDSLSQPTSRRIDLHQQSSKSSAPSTPHRTVLQLRPFGIRHAPSNRSCSKASRMPPRRITTTWTSNIRQNPYPLFIQKQPGTRATISVQDHCAWLLSSPGLDLVITVDTMVAHIAGALGKPVWLLLQHAADWRWMHNKTTSPWYPTMRIFRQSHAGQLDRYCRRSGPRP